jgi:hypothetical protein
LTRDRFGEGLALDVLHGVIVDAALGADGEDGDNVRVMELGGGEGFVAEALKLARVEDRSERKDLERDAAAQRDLLGFVDDAHTAAADLAQDAEVAELGAGVGAGGGGVEWRRFGEGTAERDEGLDGGEDFAKLVGVFGVLPQAGFGVEGLAGLGALNQSLDERCEAGVGPAAV